MKKYLKPQTIMQSLRTERHLLAGSVTAPVGGEQSNEDALGKREQNNTGNFSVWKDDDVEE